MKPTGKRKYSTLGTGSKFPKRRRLCGRRGGFACVGSAKGALVLLLTKPRRRRAVSGGLEPREAPPSELKRASRRAERCEGRQGRLSAVGVTTLNGQNSKLCVF